MLKRYIKSLKTSVLVITLLVSAIVLSACSEGLLKIKPQLDRPKRFTAYNPLECVAFSEVQPRHSIVDIMAGVGTCVAQERYHTAADLMMVAGSFAFFDTQRISSKDTRLAVKEVFHREFNAMPRSKRQWLFAGLDALDTNKQRRAKICRYLHGLPPPSYTPYYMSEFSQSDTMEGHLLVKPYINSQEQWGKSLGYVLCLLNSEAGLSTQYLELLQREGSYDMLW